MKNSKLKINYKVLAPILLPILILSLGINAVLIKKNAFKKNPAEILSSSTDAQGSLSLTKSVSAQEIYPLFECPCCGKSIDQCTCPMSKERKAFVDGLTAGDDPEDKIIMAYIKKYGLESFIDKNKQAQYKEKLISQAPADRPIIAVGPDSYDFGDISQKKGSVDTFFEIKNEGKSNLVIDKLETSCGCTSASIVYQNKEGPTFTMPGHGKENPTGWKVTIPPGEKAQLKVYYDPSVHQDFRGTATRTVSIFSNDSVEFEKKVQIDLNQVD